MDGKREIKRCIIITGMSGAGKSSALNVFEDQGFYAIDNLPASDASAAHGGARQPSRGRELRRGGGSRRARQGAAQRSELRRGEAAREGRGRGGSFSSTHRTRRLCAATRQRAAAIRSPTETQYCREYAKNAERSPRLWKRPILSSTQASSNCPNSKRACWSRLASPSQNLPSSSARSASNTEAPEDADYILDVRFLPNPNYVDDLHMLSRQRRSGKEISRRLPVAEKIPRHGRPAASTTSLSVYCETGKKQLHICFGCTGRTPPLCGRGRDSRSRDRFDGQARRHNAPRHRQGRSAVNGVLFFLVFITAFIAGGAAVYFASSKRLRLRRAKHSRSNIITNAMEYRPFARPAP